MRLWLALVLWLISPQRMTTNDPPWRSASPLPNAELAAVDLATPFLPLVKRANGEVRLKPISFNTF